MDDAALKRWAIRQAREIALREGAELALAARELDEQRVEADSTLLAAAIAKALVEAYRAGANSKQ